MLRTVVVGLGRIGWQFHLPEIDRHEGYTLTGVVDPLAERRDEALDVVKVLIETESGVLLDIDINMASAHPMQPRWHVVGTHGALILDDEADAWRARYFDPADLPPLAAQDGLAATDRRYGSGEKLPWQEATFDLKDVEAVDTYARAYSYFTGVGEPFVPLTESRELMRVLVACRADAVDNVK